MALTFRGGAHPPEGKALSEDKPLERLPLPKEIIIPLSQHIGKPANPLVKKGDAVKTGQLLADADGFISAPVHSSVTGKVTKIAKGPTPSGYPKEAILIKPSEEEEKEFFDPLDPDSVAPERIVERVQKAGLVGQGGAAFPTFVKLSPPKGKEIDWLIINGAECEPYLTRDYRMMIEEPDAVVAGLKLLMKAVGVKKGGVGIETNKPKAIEAMTDAVKNVDNVEVYPLKTKYPQGAEKMLIKAITGREVPPGKLPLDVGAVVQNVGTARAVYRAVKEGEPPYEVALTVTGGGIKEPKNLYVRVGTPIKDVIEFCGGLTDDAERVIVGGPMMGVAQYDLGAPVLKATSGILVLTKKEAAKSAETPCLRCGKCVDVCPVNLLPTRLALLSRRERFEDAEDFDVMTCMECGTCVYVCPANIPLVHWIRLGKQEVAALQRKRRAAS